jgi:hypothetical protein
MRLPWAVFIFFTENYEKMALSRQPINLSAGFVALAIITPHGTEKQNGYANQHTIHNNIHFNMETEPVGYYTSTQRTDCIEETDKH